MKPACGPDFLGPLLGHATHLARERMDARLSRYDMTPSQTHTLLYLSSHGYTAPQRDVVEHLRVRPSTANGILDRMEEKGLIRRTADENDQRQKRVYGHGKGPGTEQYWCRAAFQEAEAAMVKGLRLEETEALRLLVVPRHREFRGGSNHMLKKLGPYARPYSKWIAVGVAVQRSRGDF